MSYFTEHPEAYDTIVLTGIVKWIDQFMDKAGFAVPGEWLNGYQALVEVIREHPQTRALYTNLLHLAQRQITASEADYFSSLIDEQKERYP